MNHSFFLQTMQPSMTSFPFYVLLLELFPLQRNDRETEYCGLKLVILWWYWLHTNGWCTLEELNRPGFFCNLDEVKCDFLSRSHYSVQMNSAINHVYLFAGWNTHVSHLVSCLQMWTMGQVQEQISKKMLFSWLKAVWAPWWGMCT